MKKNSLPLGLTPTQIGILSSLALGICGGFCLLLFLAVQANLLNPRQAAATATTGVAAAPSATRGFQLPPTWTATAVLMPATPALQLSPTLTRTPLGYADSPTPRPTSPTRTPTPIPTTAVPLNLSGLNPDQVTEILYRAFANDDEATLLQLYGDDFERNKYVTLYGSLGEAILWPYRQKGLLTLEKWYVLRRYKASDAPIYFSLVISCWKEKADCWQQNFLMYYDPTRRAWLVYEHINVIEPSQHPEP